MEAAIYTPANLKNKLENAFQAFMQEWGKNDTPLVSGLREKAFPVFSREGFPSAKQEAWKSTDLSKILSHDYTFNFKPSGGNVDIESIFKCSIPQFQTNMVAQLNGWYVFKDNKIRTLPNGVVIGSLAEAFKQYSQLAGAHYGQLADIASESLVALNTAFAQDGVFIYVPDNVTVEETIQMVNIVDSEEDLMLNTRNLIILGKNSHLRLVQCDDSISRNYSFINTVTEVFLGQDSTLDHYKLQNKDDHSALITSVYFNQEKGSSLNSSIVSLNGGLIRNNSNIVLNGSHATADVSGLYLMDRYQHIDNHVFIDHAAPDCESNELFKGVLDDHAAGVFNGHILVRRDSQRTAAYQSNKNILLSGKATIDTKPFLEIYADDVKCSHGATVGQLDQEALFYIRSRGISTASARILLMYAFAAEVINKIDIPELRTRIDDMVKKRLRGELSYCEQCVLSCSSQEKKVHFEIDLSKI